MIKTKQEIAAEAYLVIGEMAAEADIFDNDEVQRALDYFSGHANDEISDAVEILPFSLKLCLPDNPNKT